MTLVQILVLAIIQGLTEFLPISSSAHLILGGKVFGWPDQGLAFDVATHLGTLLAVLVYFSKDLSGMARACLNPPRSAEDRQNRAMAAYLVIASVPALLAGFLFQELVANYLRDVRIIAWTTVLFGLLLWLADALGSRDKPVGAMTWPAALLIGLAQALALVPGVSRSGVTITAGRFLGFGPEAAARFSFLLAIPVVAAAGSFGAVQVARGEAVVNGPGFVLAMAMAAIAGWLCIAAFLALLRRVGLLPFIIYRLLLGGVLFWLIR
jgi:undecaprenyl-diphosphatase